MKHLMKKQHTRSVKMLFYNYQKKLIFLSCIILLNFIPNISVAETLPQKIENEIKIWIGTAQGSENWAEEEHHSIGSDGSETIWDVSSPALLPYLPDSKKATGIAVILLPGGGGRVLTMKNPVAIAKALQAQGIAAFILKYRTMPLGLNPDELEKQMKEDPRIPPAPKGQSRTKFVDINAEAAKPNPIRTLQVNDAIQAIRVLRNQAGILGINPERIGISGYSNGGLVIAELMETVKSDDAPQSAAMNYGVPPRDVKPSKIPLYIAVAADDVLVAEGSVNLYNSWHKAGYPVELHVYASGDHSFRKVSSTAAAGWIDDYIRWVKLWTGTDHSGTTP
jgi:acetyl esterase/lipase